MSGITELINTFVTEYKKTPAKLKVCPQASACSATARCKEQRQHRSGCSSCASTACDQSSAADNL